MVDKSKLIVKSTADTYTSSLIFFPQLISKFLLLVFCLDSTIIFSEFASETAFLAVNKSTCVPLPKFKEFFAVSCFLVASKSASSALISSNALF